jgi:2'-5' RNA ligase
MKATFVLLANNETSNMASKMLLDANQIGQLGFEMTRLPFHVSLKQPFVIQDLTMIEKFFDEFASKLKPANVHFDEVVTWENAVFGYDSGVIALHVEKTQELSNIHKELNNQLEKRFGLCPAAFDGDPYQFHMTIAIGGAPFKQYKATGEILKERDIDSSTVFSELALFYYDKDDIQPGTYFCYKRVRLNK